MHARTLWRCASIGSRAGKYGGRAFSRERCGSNGCSRSKRVLCVRTCWLTLSRKCYGRIQIVRLEVWWQRLQESKKETKLSRFVPFKRTGNSQKWRRQVFCSNETITQCKNAYKHLRYLCLLDNSARGKLVNTFLSQFFLNQ